MKTLERIKNYYESTPQAKYVEKIAAENTFDIADKAVKAKAKMKASIGSF